MDFTPFLLLEMSLKKNIFITGATSGIGKACAEKFAQNNARLILTGRRKDKLESIQKELNKKYACEVLTLEYDIQKKDALNPFLDTIQLFAPHIDLLINNAGLALGKDNFEDASFDDWDTMIDTNVKGLYYTTKALLPFIKKSSDPYIINMSSIAGSEVYENGNAYCASKFAVNAFSKAMKVDFLKYLIRVTNVCPGAVETEFSNVRFKGDIEKAKSIYKGYQPLIAEDIADVVYYCSQLPKHINIQDLVITPTAQANSFNLLRN